MLSENLRKAKKFVEVSKKIDEYNGLVETINKTLPYDELITMVGEFLDKLDDSIAISKTEIGSDYTVGFVNGLIWARGLFIGEPDRLLNKVTVKDTSERAGTFKYNLEKLINYHSMENDSDTPDFILANYLVGCLEVFNLVTNKRDKWYCEDKLEPVCDLKEDELTIDAGDNGCRFIPGLKDGDIYFNNNLNNK